MKKLLLATAAVLLTTVHAANGQDAEAMNDARNEMPDSDEATGDRAEENVLNENFAAIDKNANGEVTRTEFTTFIANADNVNRSEARRLFDAAADEDAVMTLAEFVDSDPRMKEIASSIVKPLPKNETTAMPADDDVADVEDAMEEQVQKLAAGEPARTRDREKMKNDRSSSDAEAPKAQTASAMPAAAMQERAIAARFAAMDENGDGEVRRSEYLEYVRRQAAEKFDALAGDDEMLSEEDVARNGDSL